MDTTQDPLSVLMLTLFSEAGVEPPEGIRAVASVIWNRSQGDPDRISDVCLRPRQFSCWDGHSPRTGSGIAWKLCISISKDMFSGGFAPTGPWDHYWNPSLCDPSWSHVDGDSSKPLLPHDDIGGHRFLTLRSWVGKPSE